MPAPDLMFEHGLDVKKGWFDMASLDYSAKLSGSVSFARKYFFPALAARTWLSSC